MARYLEAVQCLNLIAPKRLPEALKIADARAGLRSLSEGWDSALLEIVFSVPDEQFRWFRLVLRKKSEKYERNYRMLQSRRTLNLLRDGQERRHQQDRRRKPG